MPPPPGRRKPGRSRAGRSPVNRPLAGSLPAAACPNMRGVSSPSPLDNAVWHALRGPLAAFAEGRGPARRFHPDVAPFGAIDDPADPAAWDALRDLFGPGGVAPLFRPPLTPPVGWQEEMRWPCWQMVAPPDLSRPAVEALEMLGERDGEEMLALTAATRPGPFLRRTHELGHYVGVRANGRLIAMAGERLRVPGATEISAVCTDPAHQRRGLAAALVRVLAARIQARGETAFLHVATDNVGAIRVYEALGFTRRAAIEAVALRAPA